ncbi:hypothetical protein IW136_001357 [Coemansia sp. RSA 678]|nr:hypothetical protein IW136_001357 [Coemansia sp. RSA 678]
MGQAPANDLPVTVRGSSDAATAWEDMEMTVREEQALEVQVPDKQALTAEEMLQEQAAEIQSVIMGVLADCRVSEELATQLGFRMVSKEEIAHLEQQQATAKALEQVQSRHDKLESNLEQIQEKESELAKLRGETGRLRQDLAQSKKQAAEVIATADKTKEFTAGEKLREWLAADKVTEQAAEIERLKKGMCTWGRQQGSKMLYAQAARLGSGQQWKQVWPVARQGPPPKQKEQPAPPPLAGNVQAAQTRTPLPKWVEDSQQTCAALTVTGLAGKGVSRTQLKSMLRIVMSYQLWINLVLQNEDTVQIIVQQENWGYVVEALKKKGLMPLPALKPWEVIPKGPTDYEQARTETREHWDIAYLTENTGASALLEEGQIDEAGEGPGFSTQQLGCRYCSVNPGELPAPMAMAVDDNSFAVLQEWSDDLMDEDEKGRGAKRGRIDIPKSKSAGEQGNLEGEETHENSNLARPSASAQGIPADHCPGPAGAGQLLGSSC